jgi:transposase InsO family protein
MISCTCSSSRFLAVVLDAYSRRVIGWALDRTLEEELTLSALRMALSRRVVEPGLVHHSDRGSQYASGDYTGLLKENGVQISMSRKGRRPPSSEEQVIVESGAASHLAGQFSETGRSVKRWLESPLAS